MRRGKFAIAKEKLGRLSLSERALLAVSKHPDDVDRTSSYQKPTKQWTVATALLPLEDAFPGISALIVGKRVLDYGCGDGFQAAAMAKAGAATVLGVDIEANRLDHGRTLAAREGLSNVAFAQKIGGEFDIVVSLNAFEHFVEPQKNIADMRDALAPGGRLFVSFGPLWMAPYGHHMHFFTKAPWINLVFPEKTVFRIRDLYRDDGADCWDPGMNRMTVAKFERLVREAGMHPAARRYRTVKGLPLVGSIPVLREFFVNLIDAELVRA